MNQTKRANYLNQIEFVVVVIFSILSVSVFYPGLMSLDSFVQFTQSLSRVYGPEHPPIVAFVWSCTNRVIYGPAGMLCLQSFTFWLSMFILARGLFQTVLSRYFFYVLIGFYPPIFVQIGMIWKDVDE